MPQIRPITDLMKLARRDMDGTYTYIAQTTHVQRAEVL